jgi:hypothetical protein
LSPRRLIMSAAPITMRCRDTAELSATCDLLAITTVIV